MGRYLVKCNSRCNKILRDWLKKQTAIQCVRERERQQSNVRDNTSTNTMENKLITTIIRVHIYFKNNRKLNAIHSFEHDVTRKKSQKMVMMIVLGL